MRRIFPLRGGAALLLLALPLAACRDDNKYVAPGPPKVGVAQPLKEKVTPYLELTGNTVALDSVDLVARVPGFLQEIDYKDGAFVKKGTTLFVIEPAPYEAKVKQAEAAVASAQAAATQTETEYQRQSTLGKDQFAAQSKVDAARRSRDEQAANLKSQQAALDLARINLGYTRVTAPFDGVVTTHLVAVGALVGNNTATKLATIVSLDPIYVTFNVSEQDVLRIRANVRDRSAAAAAAVGKVPVEAGLMTETGYPHRGTLDYIAPEVDPSSGTLQVRGVFANPDRVLLPGFFARVRAPTSRPGEALLVPDIALGSDQGGSYVLLVGKDERVEQRKVALGARVGRMRVVEEGLAAADRVVVTGLGRAIPGEKVSPEPAPAEFQQSAAAAPR